MYYWFDRLNISILWQHRVLPWGVIQKGGIYFVAPLYCFNLPIAKSLLGILPTTPGLGATPKNRMVLLWGG